MKTVSISFIILLMILSGCANKEGGKADDLALIKRTNPEPMDIIYGMDDNHDGIITNVKKTVAKHKAIYDVVIVKKDRTILIAYKVKHLQRFHMKRIEKEVKQQLIEKFADYEFIVSSDYKIFLELVRLNEMLKAKVVPEEKARKKYDEIISLNEALT